MKFILETVLIILVIFSFNACQLFEDSPELQASKQALELKKLQIAQDKELAALEMKKSLATIEKEKVITLQKMQNDIKEKELNVNSEKELELIKQKISLQESNNNLNFQMYLFIFLALVIIVVTFFIYYFFKRKREDELRAYNDNIKKYFYNKENEARMKIASQILETISDGNLSKENEQKLINAFTQETSNLPVESLTHIEDDDDVIDAIAEESSSEHKSRNENE